MSCPVCLDEPNPPADSIQDWFRSLGLHPPEPAENNTLSLKEETPQLWYPASADIPSRSARLAFARALIEVRFELRKKAQEEPSAILETLQTWFGGVSSCLTRVPHPISWTVFLIIIMQQPQGQAASDGPAAGIET
jgi:hypothetical protein